MLHRQRNNRSNQGIKTVKIEMDRKMLLTLVNGVYPGMNECDQLTRLGAMQFTGNQYNPDWAWNSRYLEKLSDEELMLLYVQYRK